MLFSKVYTQHNYLLVTNNVHQIQRDWLKLIIAWMLFIRVPRLHYEATGAITFFLVASERGFYLLKNNDETTQLRYGLR